MLRKTEQNGNETARQTTTRQANRKCRWRIGAGACESAGARKRFGCDVHFHDDSAKMHEKLVMFVAAVLLTIAGRDDGDEDDDD